MQNATIVGLGLSVPEHVRTNDAWPASYAESFHSVRASKTADFTKIDKTRDTKRPFEELFRKHAVPHEDDPFKGTVERRVAPASARAIDYEAEAAKRALADARIDAKDIDIVVASALLPDLLCPTPAAAIQDAIGATNAAPIGMEAYCASALAQLDYAAGLIASGSARHVLCVQSHVINDRINMMDLPFSPLFGDAAAAFVVGPASIDRGIMGTVRGGDGSLRGAITLVHRESPGACWYREAHGQIVPGISDPVAARHLADGVLAYPMQTLRDLEAKTKMPLDAARAIITIQPGIWFHPALADGLSLPLDRFVNTFTQFAHIGACAMSANLLAARQQGRLKDGAPIILYAHGAGVTRYGIALRWVNTE